MDEWLAAVEADKRDVPLPMKIIDTKRAAGVTEGCVAADGIDAPLSLCDATVDQQATLREAFPTGVCDYSKPGTGFQVAVPWLTYQDAGARSSTAERRWASPAVDVLPGLNRLWTGGLLPARSGSPSRTARIPPMHSRPGAVRCCTRAPGPARAGEVIAAGGRRPTAATLDPPW
jgi:hypothetical protein